MYRYIATIIDDNGIKEIISPDTKIKELLSDDSFIYLKLNVVGSEDTHLFDLRNEIDVVGINPDLSITEYIDAVGNYTLNTYVGNVISPYVRYNDIFHAGYNVSPATISGIIDPYASTVNAPNLVVTGSAESVYALSSSSIISINGYLHRAEKVTEGYLVHSGNNTVTISDAADISVISFNDICTIKQIPIADSNIGTLTSSDRLSNGIEISELDITDKHILLVSLGGRLFPLKDIGCRISTTSIYIDFNRALKEYHVEWYYRAVPHIDLNSINDCIDIDTRDKSHINVEQLFSNNAIRAFLKLPQTFIIALDMEDWDVCKLHMDKMLLEITSVHGTYILSNDISKLTGPLITGDGYLPSYISQTEDKLQVCITTIPPVNQYINYTTPNGVVYGNVSNRHNYSVSGYLSKPRMYHLGITCVGIKSLQ